MSYYYLGSLNDAIADFTNAIRLNPTHIAYTYIYRGIAKKSLKLDFCGDFRSACDSGMCSYYNDYCK